MRRFVVILIVIGILTIALGFVVGSAQKKEGLEQKNEASKTMVAHLPSSLDSLFPPKTPQPIYLFKMIGLGTIISGVVADLFEGDLLNAKANFEKFKTQYVEISNLVPEWKKELPMGPVEELGAALRTGDQGKVMTAMEKMDKVCQDCHAVNKTRVEQKYHWGDFDAIRIKDPLSNEEVNFSGLMLNISASYSGVIVNLEQGQKENALKQFQGFNARFQTLKMTCTNCHDTERKYYVDDSVQKMVDQLGQILSGPSTDPKMVESLTQGIGMESCIKCHWVHEPAALAQLQWAK